MSQITFEGVLQNDSPAFMSVRVATYFPPDAQPKDRLRDEHDFQAIIDTGSRQCIINKGVIPEMYFGPQTRYENISDSTGSCHQARIHNMVLIFSQNDLRKEIELPIYEMPLGDYDPGEPYMLMGRTVLNLATLLYDGVNRKVTLAFGD